MHWLGARTKDVGGILVRGLSSAVVLATSVGANPNDVASAMALSRPATLLSCTGCYSPEAFRTAYGLQPLVNEGFDGRGQTVVLLEFEPTAANATDLRNGFSAYDSAFGLPAPSLSFVDELAPTTSPWLASGEEVEDAQMVHAMAPGAAIRVVLLKEFSTVTALVAELTAGFRLATTLGAVVSLSASFGENCFSSAQVKQLNATLETAEGAHVTVVASSGDYGAVAKPCPGVTPFVPMEEVALPASDPLVLATGGTNLSASTTTGAYHGETAWRDERYPFVGSGGGFSHRFARPGYQDGVAGISRSRGVPDVAADANDSAASGEDFDTNLTVVEVSGALPFVRPAGGTSASAPFWAAVIAIADQYAGRHLGFVNPALYQIAMSSHYRDAFHEVTEGTNRVTFGPGRPSGTATTGPKTFTGYTASPGWNPVTGWGSPNAQVLVPLLKQYVKGGQ
jgi:subtilase family serine protease